MQSLKNIPLAEYNYDLPDEKIAKYPLVQRDSSKLLVYSTRGIPVIEDSFFGNVAQYLPEKSLLVRNNTKVIPARLQFQKESGAKIEIFCLYPASPNLKIWYCMVGNARRWKSGNILHLEKEFSGQKLILTAHFISRTDSTFEIAFDWNDWQMDFWQILDIFGEIPIPPYLNRASEKSDATNYQTTYAQYSGSVAAPTAGLHFTPAVDASLKQKNITVAELTLHVGQGTFVPVTADNMLEHQMHHETASIPTDFILRLAQHKAPIIAVGTTSVRTLESLYWIAVKWYQTGQLHHQLEQYPYEAADEQNIKIPAHELLQQFYTCLRQLNIMNYDFQTQIMITPYYKLQICDAIITNFHQPTSTLLLLIASFVGTEWTNIYKHALNNHYRFLSYGDSSLLWAQKA